MRALWLGQFVSGNELSYPNEDVADEQERNANYPAEGSEHDLSPSG